MTVTLAIAVSIALGLVLVAVGLGLLSSGGGTRWPGIFLCVLAVVMQSWWLVLAALVFFKFFILREDT